MKPNKNDADHAVSDIASLISDVDRKDKADIVFEQSAQINFLRNFSIESIEPFLKQCLYQSKIQPKIVFGGYDTVEQEILDHGSHLYRSTPDLIVLSLMLDTLDPQYAMPGWRGGGVKEKLHRLFDSLASKTQSLIAVNTFMEPFDRAYGITRSAGLTDPEEETFSLNQFIRQYVNEHSGRFFLIDWNRFLRNLGVKESVDWRYWFMFKSPFKKEFLSLYALEINKIVRALKGKSKKCLVLDCDNTLWGGVVGELGINGIQLGPNEYPAVAFYEFQKSLLHMVERGVMVALCSKNNEGDVWEVLDQHPHCLLKRGHLAGWRINWENKASNIAALAKEFNIGLDSFVFVEDDSTECELVRKMLPEVAVLQVPDKLYGYPGLLIQKGLFDTLSTSTEDKKRTQLYQAESQRKESQKQFENIDEFLASLNLIAQIHEMQSHELARVAQLTQKTNQFNVTTRRYAEAEIKAFADSPDARIFTLSVRDKFGDYGLTGVFIAKKQNVGDPLSADDPLSDEGMIDTYLLSCRILGRQIETVFLNECLARLEERWKPGRWKAEYIPTQKNQQVADFWDRSGFKKILAGNGRKLYEMEASGRVAKNPEFIQIVE